MAANKPSVPLGRRWNRTPGEEVLLLNVLSIDPATEDDRGQTISHYKILKIAVAVLVVGCLGTGGYAECTSDQERVRVHLEGTVSSEERPARPFGPDFKFVLEPIEKGWHVAIYRGDSRDNIARLTPPWHFVPNPRYIEGWHFRNASNTKPNDGSVNAPQNVREFIFSPEVGLSIDGPSSAGKPTPEEVNRVQRFGQGRLEILDYDLTPPSPGEKASMTRLLWKVCLSWPRAYR